MGRALDMLRVMFVPRFGEVPAEVTTVLTDQRTLGNGTTVATYLRTS